MPSIVKSIIKSEVAQIFYKSLRNKSTRAFFYLSKVDAWADENIPPEPTLDTRYEKTVRNSMVRAHAIDLQNVVLGTTRHNWVAGTRYDMYDTRDSAVYPRPSGSPDLENSNMIVITDDFNVYKCIYNGRNLSPTGVPEPSMNKPTGSSTTYTDTGDGYIWKYMKTISMHERTRFLTPEYIPVSDVVTEGFYDGQISFVIDNGGTGYVDDNTVLQVTGDGTGASLTAVITGGEITDVIINSAGTGYTTATITVLTPDGGKAQGTGAAISSTIVDIPLDTTQTDVQLDSVPGEISAIMVTGGTGYVAADTTITITGDGTGATADVTATNTDGNITEITITNRGQDYTYATATINNINNGVGINGAADIIVSPVDGHGYSIVKESYPTVVNFFSDGIDTDIHGVTIDNEYRQAGVVLDLYKYDISNGKRYTSNLGTPCWLLEDASIITSDYPTKSQIVYGGANKDEMLVVTAETGKLLVVIESDYIPAAADEIYEDAAGTTVLATIGTVTEPDIDRHSGSILYIDNKIPFRKDENQIANLRTIIEF